LLLEPRAVASAGGPTRHDGNRLGNEPVGWLRSDEDYV